MYSVYSTNSSEEGFSSTLTWTPHTQSLGLLDELFALVRCILYTQRRRSNPQLVSLLHLRHWGKPLLRSSELLETPPRDVTHRPLRLVSARIQEAVWTLRPKQKSNGRFHFYEINIISSWNSRSATSERTYWFTPPHQRGKTEIWSKSLFLMIIITTMRWLE